MVVVVQKAVCSGTDALSVVSENTFLQAFSSVATKWNMTSYIPVGFGS